MAPMALKAQDRWVLHVITSKQDSLEDHHAREHGWQRQTRETLKMQFTWLQPM